MPNPLISKLEKLTSPKRTGKSGCHVVMPGVWFIERSTPTTFDCLLYDPVVCFVLQGSKEIRRGDEVIPTKTGQFVVVSHTIPVDYRITSATKPEPYVAIVVQLDLEVVRAMRNSIGENLNFAAQSTTVDAIAIGSIDEPLQSALGRLVACCNDPTESEVIAPLIKQEIYWRVLLSNCGTLLQQLLKLDSKASQVARSIEHIRENYNDQISIKKLAKLASMSESSFHAHFKSITTHTPLQYIKEFRLLEGRRLLQRGDHDVGETASRIGYESQSQFSREYSRRFGKPPSEEQAF